MVNFEHISLLVILSLLLTYSGGEEGGIFGMFIRLHVWGVYICGGLYTGVGAY